MRASWCPTDLRTFCFASLMPNCSNLCGQTTCLPEVERNIVKLGVQPDKAARRIAQMASAFPHATVTGFEHLVPVMSTDPKDRHVAAAAVRGGAALIVTANTRDFPPEAMARYDIEVVHPDDFLQDQLDLAEATVV